jgi:hypothetical protein
MYKTAWLPFCFQRRNQELEFAAGCASRSFLPWVRTVATSLQGLPQLVQPPSAPPVDATEAVCHNCFIPCTVALAVTVNVKVAADSLQQTPFTFVMLDGTF